MQRRDWQWKRQWPEVEDGVEEEHGENKPAKGNFDFYK